MGLDHEAIYKAYAGTVTSIDDTAGAFDASGNLVTLDQSKIDTARTTLNAEAAAVKYKTDRTTFGSTTYDSYGCLLYTSPSPRDKRQSRMPSSA